MDVISFEKASHNIHFNENNDSGPGKSFSRNPLRISVVVSGQPDHAVVTDLDQDGDLDAVVSLLASGQILWFENNKTGSDLGTLTLVTDPFTSARVPLVDLNSTSELTSSSWGSPTVIPPRYRGRARSGHGQGRLVQERRFGRSLFCSAILDHGCHAWLDSHGLSN